MYIIIALWSEIIDSSIRLIIRIELRSLQDHELIMIKFTNTIVSRKKKHAFLIIFFIVIPFLIEGFGN